LNHFEDDRRKKNRMIRLLAQLHRQNREHLPIPTVEEAAIYDDFESLMETLEDEEGD
jgi:hypothetical protein